MTDQKIYLLLAIPFVMAVLTLGYYIKKQKYRDLYLLMWALLCFFFHISWMYVSFFTNALMGNYVGIAADNQLLPIYFCNFMMYMQLFVAGWWDKTTRPFKIFATFTAWGGIFGGVITLLFQATNLGEFVMLQSSLSHTCLLITSAYLFVGGYVKINVFNVIPYTIGLLGIGVVGGALELLYFSLGLESPNAMFLVRGPDEVPEMWGPYFLPPMLAIVFLTGLIAEFITKKKEDRWYNTAAELTEYFKFKPEIEQKLLSKRSERKAKTASPGGGK